MLSLLLTSLLVISPNRIATDISDQIAMDDDPSGMQVEEIIFEDDIEESDDVDLDVDE